MAVDLKIAYADGAQLPDLVFQQIDLNGTTVNAVYWQFSMQSAAEQLKWANLSALHTPFNTYPLVAAAALTDVDTELKGSTPPTASSPADGYIKLIFDSHVKTTLTACAEGDWWFNKDDGFFYYIGKLASGEQTKNPLLKKLALSGEADSSYCNLLYDLTACMDAIQNVSEAISDGSAGTLVGGAWNLGANASDLVSQLQSVGAMFEN